MNTESLRRAFEAMIGALRCVPNASAEMLAFDGTEDDIQKLGYFFEEGILPARYSHHVDAARYVLGNILHRQFGFNWVESDDHVFLKHPQYKLIVDLEDISAEQRPRCYDIFDAIDDCLDSIKTAIARKRTQM